METKLERIAEIAKESKEEKFTSLIHLINQESLIECHHEMKRRKSPGIDQVTKDTYGANLVENVKDLVSRIKSNSYKPNPVLRKYIPKVGGKDKRALGIPSYEDKLVQLALSKILNAIYEQDFIDSSFGFRPERGCHDALKALNRIIEERDINYVVDADIKGFFDHVDHKWMITFLKHRISDPKIIRLIVKFLKSGIMEEGNYSDTREGTPQGGVISPILANVYLHYVLDLWFEKVVRKKCKGDAYIVRYADDFVCCFEYEDEAKVFYTSLTERLKKFNLEISEEKTKIIMFGKNARTKALKLGKYKPETFDFLGFTHYCSKSKKGWFRVKRKTSNKKFRVGLQKFKQWIKFNRNMQVDELMKIVALKLRGYYRYYGITDNISSLVKFKTSVRKLLYKWLNRRSQRKSFNWEKFQLLLDKFKLPEPKIYVNIYDIRQHISYIM